MLLPFRLASAAMEIFLRVVAAVAGFVIVVATLGSAIKTVILPRSSASSITRWVFLTMRRLYLVIAPRRLPYESRDRRLATYAPISLTVTLAVWLVLVFAGYTLMYMGVDGLTLREAFTLSGSSLFTLGFSTTLRSRGHDPHLHGSSDRALPARVADHVPPRDLLGLFAP